MFRVGDLKRSLDFYTGALGMSIIRIFDNPEQSYTLAFVGFGPEEKESVIELTYNYGVSQYERGLAFGHIAIGVENCVEACARVKSYQGKIVREPGPLRGGHEIIAFIQDPDENLIEFVERPAEWFA